MLCPSPAPPLPLPQAAEEARNTLLELQAITAAVESTGQAKAEAQAQAERLLIEGQSAIEGRRCPCGSCPTPHLTPPSLFPVVAQLKANAARIELDAELESQSNVSTVGGCLLIKGSDKARSPGLSELQNTYFVPYR